MPNNKWDSVTLDHIILPKLSTAQKEILTNDRFLGNYTLSRPTSPSSTPTPCNRTLAAIRLATLPEQRYHNFVSGIEDFDRDTAVVEEALQGLYDEYAAQCREAEKALERFGGGEEDEEEEVRKAEVLRGRWREIRGLLGRG